MKELYSFNIEREIEQEVPSTRKKGDKVVETTKIVKSKRKERVVFTKPTASEKEQAEFFYGQKFNEYINAGFLTRAMLSKKMGDIGGFTSKSDHEELKKNLLVHAEASRLVELYGSKKNLDEEEKAEFEKAKGDMLDSSKTVSNYQQQINSQFSQTADNKADQKIIEWFVFNFSYYEDEQDGEKKLFPVFKGTNYNDKRECYLQLCEQEEEVNSPKLQAIFTESFEKLVRVASVWYNGLAKDQESIDKILNELFSTTEE